MQKFYSADAVVDEISARIKRYRIDYPMTQKELSEKTGISLRSISRFESGEDIQFSNLIRILDALDLGENLELLVPDYRNRPSYYLTKEKTRQRASSKQKRESESNGWKWGDER